MAVPDDVFLEAVRSGDVSAVEALLEQGADVDARTERGGTALMIAAKAGGLPLVRLLLAHGAEINVRNQMGQSALLTALTKWTLTEQNIAIVNALLGAGADVNARNHSGYTALRWAANGGEPEIIRRLIAAGAEVNTADDHGTSALMGPCCVDMTGLLPFCWKPGPTRTRRGRWASPRLRWP